MCDDPSSGLGDAAAKLSVLSIPLEPSADLSAEDVVRAVCTGLQYNDVPESNTGLIRLYALSDLKCRSSITARQGAKSVERFVQYAELSLLAPLINSDAWLVQPSTLIPAPPDSPTRGDLATQVVLVTNKVNFRYRSGLERPEGSEEEETTPFRFMLERQRRPPLAGCWLVTELLCLRDEFIFNGDTGAVQG